MNEGQIVCRFLFPACQQAASAVGPTVCALDDPTAGALASAAWLGRLAALRAVELVSATLGKSLHRFARVPFVQAKMLPAASARRRTSDRNSVQGRSEQLLVVPVRARDGDTDRHAPGIGQHRSLDAELTTIGGVFPGFFPRPAAIWSSPRPDFASASRSPYAGRRCGDIPSTCGGRRPARPTPESSDARCSASQRRVATPSTDNLYATGKRFHPRQPASPRAADHLYDSCDTAAAMAPAAAKASQEFAKTCPANRNAFTHLRAKNQENTLPVLRTKYTLVQYWDRL